MIISEQSNHLQNSLEELRKENDSLIVGFVPTMGALHAGHLSLVEQAQKQADIVVVSIFVNPTQFNDSNDLKNYPRTIDADTLLLEKANCDILFKPSEQDVYPDKNKDYQIDFNGLDNVMEGKHREGHFKGVAMVVERLFEIVQPDIAFFGLKDFQQVAIIKHMVRERGLDLEIVPVPIVRSKDGLALSSRNALLSEEEKTEALIIHDSLVEGKSWAREGLSPQEVCKKMEEKFSSSNLELEYVSIVDETTLQEAKEFSPGVYCCLAAYCGDVRLIDNMQFS